MGRHKIGEGVDGRWRKTLTVDWNDFLERFLQDVRNAGMSFKQEIQNALLLYSELCNGRTELLDNIVPNASKGLRLYEAMRQGNLSVLREMLPLQYEALRLQLEADILENTSNKNQADVLKELRSIKTQLESLKVSGISTASNNNGIQSIAGIKPIAAPDFDDEDDSELFGIKKDETAGKRASANFLQSLQALQS